MVNATTLDGYSSRHDKSKENDGEKKYRILGSPLEDKFEGMSTEDHMRYESMKQETGKPYSTHTGA